MRKFIVGALAALACLVVAAPAFAAKVPVTWTNPSTNTDGSALTDLASVTVQWGSCSGSAFGTLQNSVTVPTAAPGAAMKTYIYPVDLSPVCVEAYATNTSGAHSAPSNVAQWTPPATLGKPEQLGALIHLTFRRAS